MAKEVTDLSGEKVPAWLKQQIQKASTAAPVAMPSPMMPMNDEAEGNINLNPDEEKFVGEEPQEKEKMTKKTKKGNPAKDSSFEGIAFELSSMLEDKNRQYGDSYARMQHVLPVFFPNGVPADRLLDAIFILRIVDKLMRIASNQPDDMEDPVKDIAGYAILRMREMRNVQK